MAEYLPSRGEVNILPLFTEIEKNNCFSIYPLSDLNNIFRRKPLKIDSETLAKSEFTPVILFLFGLRMIHTVGGESSSSSSAWFLAHRGSPANWISLAHVIRPLEDPLNEMNAKILSGNCITIMTNFTTWLSSFLQNNNFLTDNVPAIQSTRTYRPKQFFVTATH